jgi:hypothetical protein
LRLIEVISLLKHKSLQGLSGLYLLFTQVIHKAPKITK